MELKLSEVQGRPGETSLGVLLIRTWNFKKNLEAV